MTAKHETFHTIGGDTERVLVGVGGPTFYAPDQRPDCDCGACGPSVGKPEHQLAQLAKVLPADTSPLVSSWWTCSICGYSKPGGPPSGCFAEANLLPPDLIVDGCPLGKPAL